MKNSGFSLVELIVVIAIILVVAAIAVPVYSNYVEKAEDSVALNSLDNFVYAVKLANIQYFTDADLEMSADGDGVYTVTAVFAGDNKNYAAEQVGNLITGSLVDGQSVSFPLAHSLSDKGLEKAEEMISEADGSQNNGGGGNTNNDNPNNDNPNNDKPNTGLDNPPDNSANGDQNDGSGDGGQAVPLPGSYSYLTSAIKDIISEYAPGQPGYFITVTVKRYSHETVAVMEIEALYKDENGKTEDDDKFADLIERRIASLEGGYLYDDGTCIVQLNESVPEGEFNIYNWQ